MAKSDITAAPISGVVGTLSIEACYRLESTEIALDGTTWETFIPSAHVGSPWGPGIQHGGPVAGLLARSLEHCRPRDAARISRLTVEILGPVPMSRMSIRSWVERPGNRIELLAAEVCAAMPDGSMRAVARGRAWRLATQSTADAAHHADSTLDHIETPDLPGGELTPIPDSWKTGFANTVEWRITSPLGLRNTPTTAWVRLNQALVEGETTSDLAATTALADLANGLGARLDPHEWTFLNTELTIHLFAPPRSSWIGLSCETSIGQDGIAMSAAVLHTPDGPVGRVTQNILVEKRPERVQA